MDDWLFAVVCSPCALIAAVLNIIFIWCLHHPAAGINLRQPLWFLLIAIICNSTIQQGTTLLLILFAFVNAYDWLLVLARALIYFTYCSCFSSSAWISIFYYIKIVPHHYTMLIWIKKNIKVVVYAGYTVDQIVLLVGIAMGTVRYLHPLPPLLNSTFTPLNGTIPEENVNDFLTNCCQLTLLLYLACPLLTLTVSWTRTFIYLRRHIKRMEKTTGSSSSPQQQNQMRVTFMGILQAALFLPSCLWIILTVTFYSSPIFDRLDGNKYITLTVTTISDLANIVYLGFSQSVFRLRVAARWDGLTKAFGLLHQAEGRKV